MKQVELVFRSVGERTAARSLDLALAHIGPTRVHTIEGVRPFAEVVRRMLAIRFSGDGIVCVDADCLILEDMRPFLAFNEQPFVDCVVQDRFRGWVQSGVHILRADVVRAMAAQPAVEHGVAYLLRPESHLRNRALQALGLHKRTKRFFILHDYLQAYPDIFAKMALRELRSRTERERAQFEQSMATWGQDADFAIARCAVEYARQRVPEPAGERALRAFIDALPSVAVREVAALGLLGCGALTQDEIDRVARTCGNAHVTGTPKVCGVGLEPGTQRRLQKAFDTLGYDIADPCIGPPGLPFYDGLVGGLESAQLERIAVHYPRCRFVFLSEREDMAGAATFACCFRGRPSDYLVMGPADGWEQLCAFLNRREPHAPFPRPREKQEKPAGLVKRLVRQLGFHERCQPR